MIKNIIFDFDGVLVDSEILVSKAFCKYLGNLNISVSEKDIAFYAGNKTIDVIDKLSLRFNIEDKQKLFNDIMLIANNIYNKELKSVKGTEKFLSALNQEKFIASNSGKERIIKGLKNVSLYNFFEEKNIYSCDLVKKPKPEPDIYLKIIKDNKINPEEALIIEDSAIVTTAGVAADMRVIGLTAGGHWYEGRNKKILKDAGALAVVINYVDLLYIIRKL